MAFSDATTVVDSDLVHYIHGGKTGEGVPVVLVHGLAGATTFWARNLEPLGRRFEVYALDLPGFGNSRTQGPFDPGHEVAALAGWMSKIGLPKAVFIGHSLGAYLGVKLSVAVPERVVGLVLVAPAIFPPGYGWGRLALGLVPAPFHLSLGFWPTLLRGTWDAGPSTIANVVRELLEHPIDDELRSVRAPTLVVLGKNDTIVPSWVGIRVKDMLGDRAAGPVWLRGGHVAMWDDPEGFERAVLDFVPGLGAGRGRP